MNPATYQFILTGLGASVFAVNPAGYVFLNVPNLDADEPNPTTYKMNVRLNFLAPMRPNVEKSTVLSLI